MVTIEREKERDNDSLAKTIGIKKGRPQRQQPIDYIVV